VPSDGLKGIVTPVRAARLAHRTQVAAVAFDEERYGDSRSILRPIVAEAPGWLPAEELYGVTLYRLGEFAAAAAILERVAMMDGGFAHHGVLADSYRALHDHARVKELWEELREASPDPDLVNEGRIVYAGSLADQGRLTDAVRVMERGWRSPRRPKDRHLARAYVLAELYQRQGLLPRARELFRWIASHDSQYFDAAERAVAEI
jgi:tetratricopeptide (TPR) repeat protein